MVEDGVAKLTDVKRPPKAKMVVVPVVKSNTVGEACITTTSAGGAGASVDVPSLDASVIHEEAGNVRLTGEANTAVSFL